jgi:hypothetical protein
MTKAQAKKRLNEAQAKVKAVYVSGFATIQGPVHTADMMAIDKIIDKCLKRLN